MEPIFTSCLILHPDKTLNSQIITHSSLIAHSNTGLDLAIYRQYWQVGCFSWFWLCIMYWAVGKRYPICFPYTQPMCLISIRSCSTGDPSQSTKLTPTSMQTPPPLPPQSEPPSDRQTQTVERESEARKVSGSRSNGEKLSTVISHPLHLAEEPRDYPRTFH